MVPFLAVSSMLTSQNRSWQTTLSTMFLSPTKAMKVTAKWDLSLTSQSTWKRWELLQVQMLRTRTPWRLLPNSSKCPSKWKWGTTTLRKSCQDTRPFWSTSKCYQWMQRESLSHPWTDTPPTSKKRAKTELIFLCSTCPRISQLMSPVGRLHWLRIILTRSIRLILVSIPWRNWRSQVMWLAGRGRRTHGLWITRVSSR